MPKVNFNKETNGCGIQFTAEERKCLEDSKGYLGFGSIEEVIKDALTCYLVNCKKLAQEEYEKNRRGV